MSHRLITHRNDGWIMDDDGQTMEAVDLGVPPTSDEWRALADHALRKRGWKRTGEWHVNGAEGSSSVDRLTPVPEQYLEVGRYIEFRTSSGTTAHGRITSDRERAEFGILTVQVNDADEHRSISPWSVIGEATPPKNPGTVTCAAPDCGRPVPRRAQVPITSLGDRVCSQDCWDRAEEDL